MVKITHNQNVLAWLLDNLDVVGSEFFDLDTYGTGNVDEQKERLRKWDDAVKFVIRFGWTEPLCCTTLICS